MIRDKDGNPGNKPAVSVSMSTGGELEFLSDSLRCDFGFGADGFVAGGFVAVGVVGVGLSEGFLLRRRDIMQTSSRRFGRVVPRSWQCSDPAEARIVNHPAADEQTSELNPQ